jgi:hypothetical protein
MKADLEKFYELAGLIEIAMMTTRRPDGHLESRAMANQKRAAGQICGSSPRRARASSAIWKQIPM